MEEGFPSRTRYNEGSSWLILKDRQIDRQIDNPHRRLFSSCTELSSLWGATIVSRLVLRPPSSSITVRNCLLQKDWSGKCVKESKKRDEDMDIVLIVVCVCVCVWHDTLLVIVNTDNSSSNTSQGPSSFAPSAFSASIA